MVLQPAPLQWHSDGGRLDICVSNRLGSSSNYLLIEHQMSSRQMYVAQVGVASIFLSGSGQCFEVSEHLYSVPKMAIDKLFQAGLKKHLNH